MEKQTLIESRISLLLQIDSNNATDKSIESICQNLLKTKADIECFFITLNTEDSLLVKNNKSFIELNAKGKATLLNSNGPISNCYKEALLLATGVNSICIDTFNDLNLNNIINWVNANKRNIHVLIYSCYNIAIHKHILQEKMTPKIILLWKRN